MKNKSGRFMGLLGRDGENDVGGVFCRNDDVVAVALADVGADLALGVDFHGGLSVGNIDGVDQGFGGGSDEFGDSEGSELVGELGEAFDEAVAFEVGLELGVVGLDGVGRLVTCAVPEFLAEGLGLAVAIGAGVFCQVDEVA